jgi:hypothetical protein
LQNIVKSVDHAVVCPKEDVLSYPNLWAMVRGVLSGVELAAAHAAVYAAAHPKPSNG